MFLKDLKFEKDKITSEFQESEELENIKSGERLSIIFGKIQRWFNGLKDFNDELKQTQTNVMNIVKAQNNLIQMNNTEHAILYDSIGMQRKNLIKNTEDSLFKNGITYVVNADGSITASGTAAPSAEHPNNSQYHTSVFKLPPNTNVTLTGCPPNGSLNTYWLAAWHGINGYGKFDIGDGITFNTGDITEWRVAVGVEKGVQVDNLTFYPMLRIAGTSDTYVPYSDDLQTQIKTLESRIAALESKPEVEISEITEAEIDTVLETE